MQLRPGNQVCADGVMLEGSVEVNESLITGESDVVAKGPGDFLYSGSFIVSGNAYARVERVGIENYANKISYDAKASKSVRPSCAIPSTASLKLSASSSCRWVFCCF